MSLREPATCQPVLSHGSQDLPDAQQSDHAKSNRDGSSILLVAFHRLMNSPGHHKQKAISVIRIAGDEEWERLGGYTP
jgi:hypothetical protein